MSNFVKVLLGVIMAPIAAAIGVVYVVGLCAFALIACVITLVASPVLGIVKLQELLWDDKDLEEDYKD